MASTRSPILILHSWARSFMGLLTLNWPSWYSQTTTASRRLEHSANGLIASSPTACVHRSRPTLTATIPTWPAVKFKPWTIWPVYSTLLTPTKSLTPYLCKISALFNVLWILNLDTDFKYFNSLKRVSLDFKPNLVNLPQPGCLVCQGQSQSLLRSHDLQQYQRYHWTRNNNG